MRFRQAMLAFVLLFWTGLMTSSAVKAEDIPSILWSRHDHTKAAWISVEKATLPSGEIDWDLFGDLQSTLLKRRLEKYEGSGCVSMGALSKHPLNFRSANDLKSLTLNSLAIYRGRVVASGVGFADGEPATLLAVRVENTIKSSPEITIKDLLYVAYPVAEFSVNGLRICKSDERLTEIPEVGDGILVFPLNDPLNEDKNLIYPYFQEVMVQKQGGTLAIPGRWMKDIALGKASSLREVESMVKVLEKPSAEKPRKEGL